MTLPDQLDRIERNLHLLTTLVTVLVVQGQITMLDLSALEAQVKATTDEEASAVLLINGLADQVSALAAQTVTPADKAKLDSFAAQLKMSADKLGGAVVANTPSATVPAIG